MIDQTEQIPPLPGQTEKIDELLGNFTEKYHAVLLQLDSLASGTFDEDEAPNMAAMCLIAQASLLADLAAADLRSRALKRDIDFAKAKAFADIKQTPADKKPTDALVQNLVNKDEEVRRISNEQNIAERDYKQLSNIHALLKEAHLTFRSIKKGV
jgi:hypothetical protein